MGSINYKEQLRLENLFQWVFKKLSNINEIKISVSLYSSLLIKNENKFIRIYFY